MSIALLYIFILCITTGALFAIDKFQAINGNWRIPESVLLLFAATGGAIGGIVSMCLCHHKTQKPAFYNGLPLMMVAQTVILIMIANIFLY